MSRQHITATGQEKRVFVSVTLVWDEDVSDDAVQDALDEATEVAYQKFRAAPE